MTNKKQTHTETVSGAKAAVLEVQNAVTLLIEQRATAEQRKAVLLARCAKLYELPLGVNDIRQFMCELIDHRAQDYARKLTEFNLLDQLAFPRERYQLANPQQYDRRPRINFEDAEFALGRPLSSGKRVDTLSGNGWKLPVFLKDGEFMGWPYFFFGDVMKEKLGQLMDGMTVPIAKPSPISDAPTLDERRREIQSITLEVNSLDLELGRIQSEINSLTAPIIHGAKGLSGHAVGGV